MNEPREWMTDGEIARSEKLCEDGIFIAKIMTDRIFQALALLLREVKNCHEQIGEMETIIDDERCARKNAEHELQDLQAQISEMKTTIENLEFELQEAGENP